MIKYLTEMCQEPVPEYAPSICTRDKGHTGEHRCKAEDVDARVSAAQAADTAWKRQERAGTAHG